MTRVEFLILLLLAAALLAQLAGHLRVPYPVMLVLGGLGIAFIPGGDRVALAPDVVFGVLLPPILYAAAFTSSPRDLRAHAREIGLLSIGLVALTVAAVAVVAHAALHLSWPMAFVLGAVLAPTDPVAAVAVFRRAHVPESVGAIVEGESLVNDGAGLTLFKLAVAAATGGGFTLWHAGLDLVLVSTGGVAAGLAVAWLIGHLRRPVQEPQIEITLSLFTPYAAFIVAEHLGVSGILAVVAAGLYSGWRASDALLPETRVKAEAFWGVLAFVLEALLFVLVGLQLPHVVAGLGPGAVGRYLPPALAVVGALVVVRMAFALAVRRPAAEGAVVGWSGMRGAVSLAAALSVPAAADGRDLVLFAAFVAIVVTLVGQGMTLGPLVRAVGLGASEEAERREEEARLEASQAALARLEEAAHDDDVPDTTVERLRSTYVEHAERAAAELGHEDVETEDSSEAYRDLRRATLAAEREAIMRLRREGRLGRAAARRLQHEIDLAESRLGSA
ncbi:MAG: monovalent cation:H+ antiporter, family [Solirubrobacteraceae bacterium]|nr:monovalent cation:H+ antiporter, family [Solirubrobacteraceae bacterium]